MTFIKNKSPKITKSTDGSDKSIVYILFLEIIFLNRMNPNKFISIVLPFFLVLSVLPAVAQQQDGGVSSLLPDIDPQDIEIRGDFVVRFPGLARQPVLGFSPRPAIYRVDPDRMPFMETDEEIVAAIPISDLEPALRPEKNFIRFADRGKLYAYSGFGTFQSPEMQIFAETRVRDNESVAFHLGHQSSGGDRDFSSFRDLGGELQWTRVSGGSRWGVGVSGASSFNYSPLPGLGAAVTEPGRISYSSLGVKARWQQLSNAYRGWQSSASLNQFSDKTGMVPDQEESTGEARYHLHLNRFWEGTMMDQVFGLQVNATGAYYDTGIDGTQYWFNNNLGARYRHTFSSYHQVEAWLRFYQLYDPENNFDLYLYPDILYRYKGTGRFSVQMRLRGFVNDPSLEEIHKENRFALKKGGELEHERGLHINLHSGMDVWNRVEVYTGIDYWQYYNRGYFARWDAPQVPIYDYRYTDEATHVEWYAGISRVFRSWRTTVSARMGINYTSTDKDDIPSGEIPYVSGMKGSVLATTKPLSFLELSGWMDFAGKRKTGMNETIDGFVQMGARTDVRIHSRFGIYFKALNILDQEYEVWQDYQERPFQIYGGLTLHW